MHIRGDTSSIMEASVLDIGTSAVDLDWQVGVARALNLPRVKESGCDMNPASLAENTKTIVEA